MTAAPETARSVRTMCPMNCNPTYCGMIVEVEDDRVRAIHGDTENPDSHGFLCIRGQAAGEIVDNPLRLLQPRLRERREPGAWRDASWDAALERVAEAMLRAGPEAVAVWHGHGLIVNTLHRQVTQRFANMAGFQWWNPSIVCWGLGGFGLTLTGPTEVNTKEDMAANAELILLWGANLISQPGTAPHVIAAKRRGAYVVAIDVRRSEAFAQADEAYLIKPGADAALALGMAHVITGEGLHDAAFVAEHGEGFAAFAEHVRQFTPAWTEAQTGIPAAAVQALARRYAATRHSMILLGGSSMHKSGNGWYGSRAVACLPGLTGALGQPGGGFGPRHAAQAHGGGFANLAAVETRPPGDYVISEMSSVLDALDAGRIKVLLLLGTNMLSSFADTSRVAAALAKMDLVACFDLFMNETARGYADVVLPGTSWLEETGYKATATHLYLMEQAISPRGAARSASWVLQQLAERLRADERFAGPLQDFFPWASADELMSAAFDHEATGRISAEQLRAEGGIHRLAVSEVAHPDLRFATPSGKVEFYSAKAEAMGLPPLPVYEPVHEDASRQPERAARFPLLFRQGRAITHFHAFYDHGRALPTLADADPEPRLWLNPADAAARGLADGEAIRIHNDRGAMQARSLVTERVPAGVVWMHDGWPGINDLTSGARAVPDAAVRAFEPSGAAAYEARVQVSRLSE
ncbi:MAG TPA: molybdopterin-dependent oxidoreductase [Dehalococcoidia bacterium]|nr:molybdopterin-dependent oxidoreductase [Dehalococcoidia bacterium]